MIHDVTQLDVYKQSFVLLEKVYSLTRKLTRKEYDTIDQINRAAKSVPANISEGFAKRSSPKEFKRFLQIALGSSDEAITHLRTLYITIPKYRVQITDLGKEYKLLSRRINKLRSSWLAD